MGKFINEINRMFKALAFANAGEGLSLNQKNGTFE